MGKPAQLAPVSNTSANQAQMTIKGKKVNNPKLVNIRLCPVKRLNQNGTEIIMDFNDGMHHMVYMDIPLKASEVSRALSALSDRIADFYIKEQNNDK